MKQEIFRILDANLNRSREGLRVCEEITRFVLNSGESTKELKSVRHGIASAMKDLPALSRDLLRSRDPRSDVGRLSKMRTEMKRSGYSDIFLANMQRVKEALRVLEEFSKVFDRRSAMKFQRLRFRAYEIEKKVAPKLCGHR